MSAQKRGLFLFLTCLLLLSCIDVDDFGAYWDKGKPDPSLAGSWQNRDKDCVRFAAEKFITDDEQYVARTLFLKKHTFLMFRKPEQKQGSLFKYALANDVWTLYTPSSEKKDEFIKQYGNPNIAVGDTVTIRRLDKKTVELLQKIADDPGYWEVSSTYQRAACNPSDAKH